MTPRRSALFMPGHNERVTGSGMMATAQPKPATLKVFVAAISVMVG